MVYKITAVVHSKLLTSMLKVVQLNLGYPNSSVPGLIWISEILG